MSSELYVFKAEHGDSFLLRTHNLQGDDFVILIDGGTTNTYTNILREHLKKYEVIDLLILTHIDSDHIQGIIRFVDSQLFEEIKIKQYWFNSKNIPFLMQGNEISYSQGTTLEKLLLDKGEPKDKWNESIVLGQTIILDEGIVAEVFSPTEDLLKRLYQNWPNLPNEYYQVMEDVPIASTSPSQIDKGHLSDLAKIPFDPDKTPNADIFNSSSIAFLLKTPDRNFLFLGDARPEIYIQGLREKGYNENNKLKVDIVKISHHGSMNNTSVELMNIIDCEKYIISTNGGSAKHRLPDRETIARIIYNPERVRQKFPNKRSIFFNYLLDDIQSKAGEFVNKDDLKEGNWEICENISVL